MEGPFAEAALPAGRGRGRGAGRGAPHRGGRGGARPRRGRGGNTPPEEPPRNDDNEQTGPPHQQTQSESNRDLSQLLCYFLRHGAPKEGLRVYKGGYIQLADLVFKLSPRISREDILHEVASSCSNRTLDQASSEQPAAPLKRRFAVVTRDGVEYLRATYGHSFDLESGPELPLPDDGIASVPKLTRLCVQHICDNIKEVESFEGFPDSSLLESMMLELKARKKLTVAVLKVFLVSSLERLSFESLYVSEGTLKLVAKNCLHLVDLDLRSLGHVLSDSLLAFLLKRLTKLRRIVLADNQQLTDASLKTLATNTPQLRSVDLRKLSSITIPGLEVLLGGCKELELVDLRGCRLVVADNENLAALQQRYPGCVLHLDESRDQVRFNSHDDPLWGPLSNNYPASFRLKGHLWPTVTHYYQAQKYAGTEHEARVREAPTTSLAFSRGTDTNRPLRIDWEDVKRDVMLTGIRAKMEQNEAIARLLLSTGTTEIVFASWRDDHWGSGQDGTGKNELGKLLGEIRESLRNERKDDMEIR